MFIRVRKTVYPEGERRRHCCVLLTTLNLPPFFPEEAVRSTLHKPLGILVNYRCIFDAIITSTVAFERVDRPAAVPSFPTTCRSGIEP